MRATSRIFLSLLLTFCLFMLVRHGASALRPVRPSDMPPGATFMQSGYNLQRNEPTGEWVACSLNPQRDADFCRVTDTHGTVIFQGDYLPLRSRTPVANPDLHPSADASVEKLWVRGPAESLLVPVIPLVNGTILVPADDSEALADRWSRNPEELARMSLQ